MLLMPKCRGESDLGLCTTSGLAKGMRLRRADFRFKNMFGRTICQESARRSRILVASPEVVHRPDLDRTLLYILILRTYTKFVWEK